MSNVWSIKLKKKMKRDEFDRVAKELGIEYSPFTVGGNTYYDRRLIGEREMGMGGVEIELIGIDPRIHNTPYVNHIQVRTAGGPSGAYEAMKKATVDMGERLPFKDIIGEWLYMIAKFDHATGRHKPISYNPAVFKSLEDKLGVRT